MLSLTGEPMKRKRWVNKHVHLIDLSPHLFQNISSIIDAYFRDGKNHESLIKSQVEYMFWNMY